MSKSYLKYLFTSRKFALLFLAVMYTLLCAIPFIEGVEGINAMAYTTSLIIGMFINIAMTFVLPVLLFSFVHKRRSADQMMALPMSRKQLLITPLLFGFLLTGGCWTFTSLLMYVLFAAGFVSLPLLLGIIGFGLLIIGGMLIINTALFMTANNVFDGIVMIAAYTFVPLLVQVCWYVFTSNMVAGASFMESTFAEYLSPIFMSMKNLTNMMDGLANASALSEVSLLYFLLPAVYVVAACFALVPLFIRRKSERADQLSDGKAAYPLVATVYLFGLLLMVSFSTIANLSITTTLPFYLLLLLAYVISQFVYRRSISFNAGIFLRYGICLVAGLVVAFGAWSTEGFGMARNYSFGRPGTNLVYNYNIQSELENLEKPVEFYSDVISYASIDFEVTIPVKEMDKHKEIQDILEKKRSEAITAYYDRTTEYPCAGLYVSNSQYFPGDANSFGYYQNENYYNYNCTPFTLPELQEIEKYTTIHVNVCDEEGNWFDYSLDEYLEEYGG